MTTLRPASEFKTADERAGYLFSSVALRDLPPLAVEYARHLAFRMGASSEVLISAYATYANVVEGLPVADSLYAHPDEAWWRERGYLGEGSK